MKKIWDPLRKIEVAATPEEYVRQWFIGVLRDSAGVPEHMMMSEVGMKFGRKAYRADIIVYSRDAGVLAIAECKKPSVKLTEEVVEQVLRYNMVLGVKYIFLTNGTRTILLEKLNGKFEPMDRLWRYDDVQSEQTKKEPEKSSGPVL